MVASVIAKQDTNTGIVLPTKNVKHFTLLFLSKTLNIKNTSNNISQTKNGKEMHRRAKQNDILKRGDEARRRERYNAKQKKKAQRLAEKVQIHAMRKMMRVWDGRATILILVFLVAL